MKKILVIGAGRSSSSLVKYLLDNAEAQDWKVTLADRDLALAESKLNGNERGEALLFEADNHLRRKELIEECDLVISMLPASMHMMVAADAIELGKNLITPSYVSPEMKELNDEARRKGVLLLNEMGVDPGIDHMSAMRVIDEIKSKGGKLIRFESFTGGLIAPQSDDNPWHYKFTWNPRNVIMAGMGGTAQYIQNHNLKYIPIHKIFERYKEIEIEGYGVFEGYANRDSLSYRSVYGLEDVPTIYRGTLRGQGYCKAWNVFVQLGMTTEDFEVESKNMTWRDFINSYLQYDPELPVEGKIQNYLNLDQETMDLLKWTGIFDSTKIGVDSATPAALLQLLLEDKWKLKEDDKDMIVMWHRFDYELDGQEHQVQSSMVAIGEDHTYTAMSNTVGLPMGIAAKMILNGEMKLTGVQMPILPEVYEPILDELTKFDIQFVEKTIH
ncbi:MAG: saccharopine dehydrogenase NADP-binding domain-containing protein [Flavobacteriales bacterium]|nr:saccharopine dehydrogenase NADP-binding domain-containing protein [Flavobacteriales bacterium]